MPTPSPTTTSLLCLVLCFALLAVARSANDDGPAHLRLYIHETFAGANATMASLAASPVKNSSFGGLGTFDDELREGSDAGSQYLGRVEGLLVQADQQSTVLVFAFTEGDYKGSTLVVDGLVDFGKGVVERGIVGGTGQFRRATGYSLMSKVGNPTPSTVVYEVDMYVKVFV